MFVSRLVFSERGVPDPPSELHAVSSCGAAAMSDICYM
jgi:hypothetical protein